MHQASPRITQLGDRFATDFADFDVIGDLSSITELATTPGIEDAIVVTDSATVDGSAVIDRVRAIRALGARAVVISASDFPAGVVPGMAAGADAVLPPESSSRRVGEQIRLVANRARLMKSQSKR